MEDTKSKINVELDEIEECYNEMLEKENEDEDLRSESEEETLKQDNNYPDKTKLNRSSDEVSKMILKIPRGYIVDERIEEIGLKEKLWVNCLYFFHVLKLKS